MAEKKNEQVNEAPVAENENVVNNPVETSEQSEEQSEKTSEQQKAEETPAPKTYDFEKGDVVTEGDSEIGVFDYQSEEYLYFTVQGTLYGNRIKHVYLETLSAKSGKQWRKATDLEKKFFQGELKEIASKIHL